MSRRQRILILGLAGIVLAVFVAELCLGPYPVPFGEVWRALRGEGADAPLILDLRLPRALLALSIGAGLAVAGAAMQALLRNPLAEPGLTGVSAGAALAAALAFTLMGQGGSLAMGFAPYWLSLAALAGGGAAALLVTALARSRGGTGMASLLLAGVAFNAVAGAAIAWLSLGLDSQALRGFLLWAYGDLGRAGWHEALLAMLLILVAVAAICAQTSSLDALLLGEPEAAHLGIRVERLKRLLLAAVVLAAAAGVAAAGPIGFIGLIAPHIARRLFGIPHRRLLPAAALIGAGLLGAADLAARLLARPDELPVGVLTALIGGPFFLALLVSRRGRMDIEA